MLDHPHSSFFKPNILPFLELIKNFQERCYTVVEVQDANNICVHTIKKR